MRIGLIAGFAFGYYIGSKAGRERYEQIRHLLEEARQSRAIGQAQAAVERGIERLRERTGATTGELEPEASS